MEATEKQKRALIFILNATCKYDLSIPKDEWYEIHKYIFDKYGRWSTLNSVPYDRAHHLIGKYLSAAQTAKRDAMYKRASCYFCNLPDDDINHFATEAY